MRAVIDLGWAPGVQPGQSHHNKNENYFKLVLIMSMKRNNSKTKTDQQKMTVGKRTDCRYEKKVSDSTQVH